MREPISNRIAATKTFILTRSQALIFIQDWLATGRQLYRSKVASGVVKELENPVDHEESNDEREWSMVDEYDSIQVAQSSCRGLLLRTTITVNIGKDYFHVVSYYKQWETVDGTLSWPEKSMSLSPMENLRWRLNV